MLQNTTRWQHLLLVTTLLAACGGNDETGEETGTIDDTEVSDTDDASDTPDDHDAVLDAGPDDASDSSDDAQPDVAEDADHEDSNVPPPEDVTEDTAPDSSPDTTPDATMPEPGTGEREDCGDGVDNDGDGLVDCADSDCAHVLLCTLCEDDGLGDVLRSDAIRQQWNGRTLPADATHTYTFPVCPNGSLSFRGEVVAGGLMVSVTTGAGTETLTTTDTFARQLVNETGEPQEVVVSIAAIDGICAGYALEHVQTCATLLCNDGLLDNQTPETALDFFSVATQLESYDDWSWYDDWDDVEEDDGISGDYLLRADASDTDMFVIELCPYATGLLYIHDTLQERSTDGDAQVHAFLRDGDDLLDPAVYRNNSRTLQQWNLSALAGPEARTLLLQMQPNTHPLQQNVCADYTIGMNLDCSCSPDFSRYNAGGGTFGLGMHHPHGRVNPREPFRQSIGGVCAGAVLEGRLHSSDPALRATVRWNNGSEQSAELTETFRIETGFTADANFIHVRVETDEPCATFDLELLATNCACDNAPDDSDDPETAPLLAIDPLAGYHARTLQLSGIDKDFVRLEGLKACETVHLQAEFNTQASYLVADTREMILLDANLEVLATSYFDTSFHEAPVQLEAPLLRTADIALPLLLQVRGNHPLVCDDTVLHVYTTCLEEVCDDGVDNDHDGNVDCDDEDCHSQCYELHCRDGIDNDGNGLVDCDDPMCSPTLDCMPPGEQLYEMFDNSARDPNSPLTRFDLSYTQLVLTPSRLAPFYHFHTAPIDAFPVVPGSAPDTEVLALYDDDAVEVTHAFDFQFFGASHDRFHVISNGALQFGSSSEVWFNTFDTFHSAEPVIAVMASDLNPASTGVVLDRFPTHTVVTWNGVPFYGAQTPNYAQVVLHDDHRITLSWLSTGNERSNVLVGVSRGGATTLPIGRMVDFR